MTSPDDILHELRQQKRALSTYRILTGGLEAALYKNGAELVGLSVKCGVEDYLLTLRGDFEGKKMVCWVGASSLANLFTKAAREAGSNTLRWKVDRWAKEQV